KRAYCLKTQPATGETYPKSDLFNKAVTLFPLPEHRCKTVFLALSEILKLITVKIFYERRRN
ncbi:hypothetical protein, partial [Escherichia coli]|uniref:hypothetical protein n=1 Tax=Escherichia coli TaxID=562 RepID=UPI001BE9A63B